jgi:hypothetical protein
MGEHANLAPGSVVPVSGKYRCCFCGQGGIADIAAKVFGDLAMGGGAQFQAKANQNEVRYFQAGKRFGECPNCGGGTGWTLLDGNAPSVSGTLRHDAVVEESGVCDVCSAKVVNPGGYLLTTREVVCTPAYWRRYCEVQKSELQSMGIGDFEAFRRNTKVRDTCAKAMADQVSNWMVCDGCIDLFQVNKSVARAYARRWWESKKTFRPAGTGAAPLSAVDMGTGPDQSERSWPAEQAEHERTMAIKAETEMYTTMTTMIRPSDDPRLKGLGVIKRFFVRRRILKEASRRFHAASLELTRTAGPAKTREVLDKIKL